MTDTLTAWLDLDSLLAGLVQRAGELLPFDSGGIVLYDPQTRMLNAHTYHTAAPGASPPRGIKIGEGLIGETARHKQVIMVDDLESTSQRRRKTGAFPVMRAALAAPILFEDELLGVFVVESATAAIFEPQHQKILQLLADQAGMAINTGRLYGMLSQRYERLTDTNEELYVRNEISRLISSDEPLVSLLPRVAEYVARMIGVDACALTLWDAAEQRTKRLAAYGLDLNDYLTGRRRPVSASSLTEQLVTTGQPVIINNAQSLEDTPTPFVEEYEARSILAMPLIARGKPIGGLFLLNLSDDQPFTQMHAERVVSVLDQIALAIDNRMLLQDMKDRLAETSALLEIAARAASSLDPDDMLQHVLKLSQQMLGVTVGVFMLYNRQFNRLEAHPTGHFGIPKEFLDIKIQANQPGNRVAIVFQSGSPFILNDMAAFLREGQTAYAHEIEALNLHNAMITPLRVQDEPMGVIILGNKTADFTRADAQLMMAMGSHVAAALRSNELLKDTRERLRETEALQRIAAITSSMLDLDAMLERVVREAAELMDVEGAALLMPAPNTETLILHVRSAYGSADTCEVEDHMLQVYRTGRPFVGSQSAGYGARWRNIITFPLNSRNRTLGTLSLIDRRAGDFEDMHIDLTRAIASQIATSIENAQLFSAERRRADVMALVNRISQELTATLSLSELTRKVVRAISERLGLGVVNILLLDESGLNLTVRSSASTETEHADASVISANEGIVGIAIRTGETQFAMRPPQDNSPARSMLVTPLKYGTRILGAIEAISPRTDGFDRTDSLALETLAAQVSIAVENARLWDQARRRLLEQGIVHQIGQDLIAILDYSELVNAVVKHMTRALDTAECLLVSYDPDTERVTVEAEYRLPDVEGEPRAFVGGPPGPHELAAITRAIRTRRQVIYAQDAEGDAKHQYLHDAGIHAQLTVPMVAGDRAVGCVVWIETRGPREFTGGDVRLAQTLTTQAAIAIENARLFRQAQRQAREQELLRRVAVGLSTMPNNESMLDQLAYEITQAIAVDNVAIAMRGKDGELTPNAYNISTRRPETMLLNWLCARRETQEPVLSSLDSGASLRANPEVSPPELAPYFAEHPVTVMLTPIMRKRREVIGIIEVSVDSPVRVFDPHEIQLLEAIANQGAIAYDNILYHEREQLRLRQLERLQVSARNIASQLRRKLLLDTIVLEAAQLFEVQAVSLMTPDATGHYVIRASVGLPDRYHKERRPPIFESREITTLWAADHKTSPAYDLAQDLLIQEAGIVNVIVIPLVNAGQQMGILNLYGIGKARHFGDEDKDLALLFASQAAIGLENALLFETLEERAIELTKANKLKSEFLARVSHELRTPMNSINGYSEMLLRSIYGALNEKQADRIERILRNGRNLLAIIDDLLDISKIDAGKMELNLEAVNLRDEIATLITNLESQAATRSLYLRLEAPSELPPVQADVIRVRQVITNLLSNALKFTKQGGVTVYMQVIDTPDRREVWTTVRDTGIGIRKEDQAIIFDEFRQADGSETREYGGTGLGLAITRRLLQMMAGRIWVESEVGRGSAFTFVLPCA